MTEQERITSYTQRIVAAVMPLGVPELQARFIATQAALESNKFASHVFLTSNNAFGMKMPSVRKDPYIAGPSSITMTSEGSTPYAAYNSVEDSAKSMVNWLQYHHVDWSTIKTPAQYDAFLVQFGYHGASQSSYTAALIKIYDQVKDVIIKHKMKFVVGGAVLLAGYFIYIWANRKTLAA